MKEILEYIVKSLVDFPEQVSINEIVKDDSTITYEINVYEEDKGKIIGKQGRIAKAIRTVMRSIAAKEDKKIIVDII